MSTDWRYYKEENIWIKGNAEMSFASGFATIELGEEETAKETEELLIKTYGVESLKKRAKKHLRQIEIKREMLGLQPTEIKRSKKTKRKYKPQTPKNIRLKVLERDSYRCQKCGHNRDLEVHHIKHRAKGGTDELDNLVTLCDYCHYEQHKNEPIAKLMYRRMTDKIIFG